MSQNIGSATPGRVTRSKSKEPLPALQAKQSHAYGSQGKLDLGTQVRSSGASFAQAFGSTRPTPSAADQAVPEAQEEMAAPVAPSPRKKATSGRSKLRPVYQPVIYEEDETQTDDTAASVIPGRNTTALQSYAMYDGTTTVAAPEKKHQCTVRSVLHLIALVFLLGLSSGVFLVTAGTLVPLPKSLDVARENFIVGCKFAFGVRPFDVAPRALELEWIQFKHDRLAASVFPGYNGSDFQRTINLGFFTRMQKIEERFKLLEGDVQLLRETVTTLQRVIPDLVAVELVDGQYSIPAHFWAALQARLSEEGVMAPLWQEYVSSNEQQMTAILSEKASNEVGRAIQNKLVITQEQFIEAVKENNDWLSTKYSSDFRQMWQQNFDYVKELATTAATEVIEREPTTPIAKEQLEVLAKANDIHNAYEALHTVNWFSVGLGARIDPHLTSPTFDPNSWQSSWTVWLFSRGLGVKPNPPIEAIRRWEEATDCWCAANQPLDAAQITVQTPQLIFPDRLVIEHMPATGTLDIASAPKDLEIWMETQSAADAERVNTVMREIVPFDPKKKCGAAPSVRHVCIGQGKYDIHLRNYVQTIPMWVDTEAMGISSNKVTVRANSNWGSPWTCFYRLRITGAREIPPM